MYPITTQSREFKRVSMGASEDDAASEGADSCGSSTDSIPAVRIWGPVPKEQAVAVGALAAASSMVLEPHNVARAA